MYFPADGILECNKPYGTRNQPIHSAASQLLIGEQQKTAMVCKLECTLCAGVNQLTGLMSTLERSDGLFHHLKQVDLCLFITSQLSGTPWRAAQPISLRCLSCKNCTVPDRFVGCQHVWPEGLLVF